MIEIRHAKWECKKVIENQSLRDHLCMYGNGKDEYCAAWNLRVHYLFFKKIQGQKVTAGKARPCFHQS